MGPLPEHDFHNEGGLLAEAEEEDASTMRRDGFPFSTLLVARPLATSRKSLFKSCGLLKPFPRFKAVRAREDTFMAV